LANLWNKCEVDVVVGGTKIFVFSARAVLLTLCSYFCALAVNSGVALWLARPPSATLENESVQLRSAPTKPPLASYAVVYTRDLFNAVKAPPQTEGAATIAGNTGPLRLWGTAVGDTDRAFAIIEDLGTRTQGLYHQGDLILPGVTLVEVHWDRVVIYRNGRRETLTLPTTPPTSVPLPTVTAATEPVTNQEQDGIRQVAQDSFQIDRLEVDRAMNNLNELFTQARAVPYSSPEGEAQGFRLFSIKPQSLVDRIGLKNGDVVQRVNGVEISDPSTAFGLLQELQGYSQVRVDIMRNHQALTLSYEIQ
jgi:general secretion pathway protein C